MKVVREGATGDSSVNYEDEIAEHVRQLEGATISLAQVEASVGRLHVLRLTLADGRCVAIDYWAACADDSGLTVEIDGNDGPRIDP